MKTALTSIGFTLLVCLAFYLAGKSIDAADCAVLLLLSTLLVWTTEQYRRKPDEPE